ncbi:MAG: hypothetical protein ACP5QR_12510 [Rhizomicrobium sp.]
MPVAIEALGELSRLMTTVEGAGGEFPITERSPNCAQPVRAA